MQAPGFNFETFSSITPYGTPSPQPFLSDASVAASFKTLAGNCLPELTVDWTNGATPIVGYQSGSCGYCKDPTSSGSYYANSNRLTTRHYQELVDRGWRRSGTTLYKPDIHRSCCPHYTIRLPAAALKPTRDQRQALNRWNKFVLGERYMKESAKLHPRSKEEKARLRNDFDLSGSVHGSEYSTIQTPPIQEHRFVVNLEADDFSDEKYELFEQYQRLVHKESPSQISKISFKRFLCSSPLVRETRRVNGKLQKLGSFHQCYRLDGRLIAMSVLDLLDHGVSAVYFIYDHDMEKWSFGKLSALREATLAVEGEYQYYYMGFYIHSCAKMRYKGDYKPQYILDPVTYRWDILDDTVKSKLEANKFVSLPRSSTAQTPSDKAKLDDHTSETWAPSESPSQVAACGRTIFDFGMVGIMTLNEIKAQVELDEILVSIGRGATRVVPVEALVGWGKGSYHDSQSIKGIIAELVACVGPRVAREMLVNFSG